MSYLDQEGIIRSSGIERLTARLNGNSQALGGRLRLGLNLTSALSKDDFVTYENVAGFEGGLFTNVYDFNPTLPIYDDASPDGFYEIPGQVSIRNPVAIADQIVDEAETTRTLGNISAELDLFAGLTGRVNIGGDRAVSRRNAFFPRANPIGALTTGRAVQRDLERTSITFQSYLTYRNTEQESDHSYDVLGGYEFNEFTFEGFGTEARNFITDVTGSDAIEAGTVFQSGTFSDKEQSRLISFFGRANYNFQEKYYLSGSLRYDGSSRFGADNKWALFPAISGAWRISQESFLADNTTISDLRLRAGYGVVGNQAIPNYLSLALLRADAGNRAVLGGSVFTGYAPFQLPNAGLRWEEKEEFTIGLDYGLFDGTVYGALEFYRNTTDNLLLDVPLPQPSPVSSRIENVGSLRNTGIDFTVEGLLINQEDLSLTLGGVFNTNSNEIVDLGGRQQIFTGSVSGRGQSGQNALLLTPGQPFPVFYTFEFVEVNGNGDQLFNDYEDTDGDGFGDRLVGTTTAPTDDDRRIVGDPRPDFSYGFRGKVDYKQWGLSLFFRGEQGRELFNNSALVFQTKSAAAQGRNFFADALDDPDALREAAVFSSRWIQDASFLKLDNITLEYRIDGAKISPHVRNARLFASVDNAFTVTPYSGYDPEVNTNAQVGLIPATGIDYTNYPLPRTFTLGVQLGF
jgi:iron complex outermembrane receptor protein